MNSRQDIRNSEKKMHFLGDILHILGGFRGKILPFGGVILVQDLGRIRISW